MRAGTLRNRVSLQRPVVVKNDMGEVIVDDWSEIAKVWAAIEPVKGSEYFTASEFRSHVITRIRIRWRPDVDGTVRVVNGDTVYTIDALLSVRGLTRELHLMCSCGVVTEGGQP
jgi:SPP1 family predicted phage head-tail adaptor